MVSMKDPTLTNFNSHSYNIMLMVFLPIEIRGISLKYINMVMTLMSYFFNFITQKVIDEAELPCLK